MSENALEKRVAGSLKGNWQYAVTFGVITVMLYVAGLPLFVFLFFGSLAFFLWKVLLVGGKNDTRRVFEFYLAANEILREDDRRWYGFEIKETILLGESILHSMKAAPPLVYFSLGALYQKIGDHSSAARYLSNIFDERASDETAVIFPSPELREYVAALRKIERAPAEAPQTSAAIRALERARKNRGRQMLELSRQSDQKPVDVLAAGELAGESTDEDTKSGASGSGEVNYAESQRAAEASGGVAYRFADFAKQKKPIRPDSPEPRTERETISEVLRDIYDKNA